MLKTNKSGQKLYPFNCTDNAQKLRFMYNQINDRLCMIANGKPEDYPGELEILNNNKTELKELTDLCTDTGIVYLTGNLLSRAKNWVAEYNSIRR